MYGINEFIDNATTETRPSLETDELDLRCVEHTRLDPAAQRIARASGEHKMPVQNAFSTYPDKISKMSPMKAHLCSRRWSRAP